MPPQSGQPPFWRSKGLALICTGLFLHGCSSDEEPAPQPPRIAIVEPLQAAEPEAQALQLAGVVESVTRSQLAFQVPGRIQRIIVEEGVQVQQGQLLAELDPTDFQLQLREAKAQRQYLQADLQRKQALLEEGIIAPAAVEPLQANLIAAEVARDTAQRNIAYSKLTAPFDGVIAQRMAERDTVVDVGTPIFQLQDNSYVEVGVDLSDLAAMSLPLGPELQAEGELVVGGIRLPLHYKEHSTEPRQGSRTYRLILRGQQPEGLNLLPGMAMRVSLQVPPQPGNHANGAQFRLPLTALQIDAGNQHFVWLAIDGQAQRRALHLHGIETEQALVSGELEAGADVIVAGGSKLSEGQSIQTRTRD